MTQHATCSFVIDDQQDQPVDWTGGAVSRSRFRKNFTGDLTGTSVVEATLVRMDDDGPALYLGVERIDGVLAGRSGSFVLVHSATAHAGRNTGTWAILDGSGTGDLIGLSGSAQMLPDHQMSWEYDLDDRFR